MTTSYYAWDGNGTLNFAPGLSNGVTFARTIDQVWIPIGGVIAWLKTYTNTPALPEGWVECNGQVLSDSESPINGKTMPDLNTTQRFIRGNSVSGGTGGADTFSWSHYHDTSTSPTDRATTGTGQSVDDVIYGVDPTGSLTESVLPPYYEVVYIVRVK